MGFIGKLFSKVPEMETERLKFRAIKRSDDADIYEYSSNPETSRFLLWEPHGSIAYTRRFIEAILTKYKIGEYHDWAIVTKNGNKMIGTCGFTRIDQANGVVEIGYVINPDYWGNGYATEAARKVMRFAFDELLVNRVEAKFMFGNDASLKVMSKIGMKFEGYLRESMLVKGKYKTIGVASILRREYLLLDKYN